MSPSVALLTLFILAAAVLLTERLEHDFESHGGHVEDLSWWDASLSVVEHVLIVLAVLIPVLIVRGRIGLWDLGFRRAPWRPSLGTAAVAYSTYLVVAAVLFAILGAPPERDNAHALAGAHSTSLLAAFALIACVLVPVTEELLFRGFLFAAFRRRLAAAPAALLAGCIFGAVHGPPLGTMLDLALLGVALCALYEQTGSLLPCIGVHSVHNGIAFGSVISLAAPATLALTLGAVLLCLSTCKIVELLAIAVASPSVR